MEDNMKEEVDRRRAAWAAFGPLKESTDQLTDPKLRAHVLIQRPSRRSAAAVTWADLRPRQDCCEQLTERLKRVLLKFSGRTQHLAGLRSSDLQDLSHLRDPDF
ncbi:hypothetical protein KIN20_015317 [Parelaphostrongylus tenuis]|uniref:Uncharacterized protein n=1 Tax=Parelaphostrongylus tenuis TaxID=148309 RepID=A0AAD5QPS4_PARTN|nr:hypothetical protein KIN20_015317 [Parelaphostrongylus tenuis]